MMLALTNVNVTNTTENICFVMVDDVDICDTDGIVLKGGTAFVKTSDANSMTTKELYYALLKHLYLIFIGTCHWQ